MTLPEFAAEHRRLPHGVRSASTESSAASPSAAVVTVGRWDRQTDGRTDGRTTDSYIDPAPHTMGAASIDDEFTLTGIKLTAARKDCFSY